MKRISKQQNYKTNILMAKGDGVRQFWLFQARKAPRRASAPTRPLLTAMAGDAPLLLVGVVEVSDEVGLRAPELLPVFAVAAVVAGTVRVSEAAVAATEVEKVLEVEVVMSNWGD